MQSKINIGKRGWGWLGLILIWSGLFISPAQAQFIDPNNAMILNTLREISAKNHLALQEQRLQTAKMVQQLRQFYDTYSLLRTDIEFSQSLYNDFKAIDNMDLTNTYALTNFINSADRPDYWFPSLTGEMGRAAMDAEALLSSQDELKRTYESFALSLADDGVPQDAELRRQNALAGQQAYSQALFEYALRCQVMAKSYDSMAVELNRQVTDKSNKYTPAERTELLLKSVELRNLSNNYYEKYLELSQKAHDNELNMYDEKLNALQSKENWKTLQKQANKTSRVRYGFFDIAAPAK